MSAGVDEASEPGDVRRRRGVPLVVIFSLGVLLPLAVLAAGLGWLFSATGRGIAENLGASMLSRAVEGVRHDVSSYLAQAMAVSDLYARRVETGRLPMENLQTWETPALEDMLAHKDIASICFANAAGDTTWVLRAHGRMEVGRVDGPRDHAAIEYEIFPDGRIGATPLRQYRYVASSRPWYEAAVRSAKPTWIPVYFWFGDGGLATESGTAYTRAFRDEEGQIQGALVVDVTLGALSEFLKSQPLASQGRLMVIDGEGQLVASSDGEVISEDRKRLALAERSDGASQEIVRQLAAGRTIADLATETFLKVTIDGEPSRARIATLQPYPGIDWWVIAVIHESAFLADTQAASRRAAWVSVGMIAAAALLGLVLSRRLSEPLVRLNEFVRSVSSGDFGQQLNLKASRELSELSRELNAMSAGLKQRMEMQKSLSVAMQVQQSLLPAHPPAIPGLEIAGHSRYCDATGGDYYDFIELSEVSSAEAGRGLVIAVGDVMGHGIAAALLMATARAALRANAKDAGSLGELMTTVNHVLAQDAKHGRFVTLALVVVDVGRDEVRWASAGHDPVLQFLPGPGQDQGTFRELEGGDYPLGIVDRLKYQEYRISGLARDSVLVIGTDGVWEAMNPDGEAFGKERLKNVIRAHAGRTADEISEAIRKSIEVFADTRPITDDITFVVVKVLGRPR